MVIVENLVCTLSIQHCLQKRIHLYLFSFPGFLYANTSKYKLKILFSPLFDTQGSTVYLEQCGEWGREH